MEVYMSLVRFDPFLRLRELDRLFETPRIRTEATWLPRIDILDGDAAVVVRAEVPGVDADSIDVTVQDGALTISGTRRFETEDTDRGFRRKEIYEGTFSRTIMLPKGVAPDDVTATSKDGILEVTVPKRPEVLPHTVAVEAKS